MGKPIQGSNGSGTTATRPPVVLAGVDPDGKVRPLLVDDDGSLLAAAAAVTPTLAAVVAQGNSANTHKITNVVDPQSAQDAATKAYVDAAKATVVDSDGFLHLFTNSAPTDGSLQAGELKFWFDYTDGAAKVMFKGKSADGTVVTGSVALS